MWYLRPNIDFLSSCMFMIEINALSFLLLSLLPFFGSRGRGSCLATCYVLAFCHAHDLCSSGISYYVLYLTLLSSN
uniref:Uncharacterized protein n=1 Tax=Rhizophora mucronata TaxID=61149 RepID=A0A2P2NY36_RHIMU